MEPIIIRKCPQSGHILWLLCNIPLDRQMDRLKTSKSFINLLLVTIFNLFNCSAARSQWPSSTGCTVLLPDVDARQLNPFPEYVKEQRKAAAVSAFCRDPWGQAWTLHHQWVDLWDEHVAPSVLRTRDPSECSMSQLAQEGLSPAHLISQAVLALDGRGDTHSDESSTSPRARCCSLPYCTSKT